MMKNLTVSLDESVYQRLLDLCGGDEKKLQEAAAATLEHNFSKPALPEDNAEVDPKALEEYLNKSPSGGRSYGIKGQGW